METSSTLLTRACEKENVQKDQLFLHSDNGGPMKGATMLATLQKLGVMPSFSRPKVSDDNPYSESLFRTLKYRPTYPTRAFKSIEDARSWVKVFVQWYNYEHLHSGIKFVTPASRHAGEDAEILAKRKIVYERARNSNPSRWIKRSRDWTPVDVVVLNKLKRTSETSMLFLSA